MTDPCAATVLEFWFGAGADYGRRHKRWFEKDPALAAAVRARFLPLYEEIAVARRWLDDPRDRLARIIALDQFPRHLFRGEARAFATDAAALETARTALEGGDDRGRLPVERLFMHLPFEHSESLADQRRACELMRPLAQYKETWDALRYAEAHRGVIERFGRFPHRNALLGRVSTPEEIEFLKQPGSGF